MLLVFLNSLGVTPSQTWNILLKYEKLLNPDDIAMSASDLSVYIIFFLAIDSLRNKIYSSMVICVVSLKIWQR